ncbi:hypothetical protein P3M90_004121 [Salmonella enterica]|uniref:DNA primase/helicase Gp4 N-terminal Bacteriophage T7-like domain-containing protein n=3 Tax=Salmonella houtenae TaxID=59205 RepID=A0A702LG55_SALHO|nr:hypothetical protein [Salmonella enterica subsp. houtenae]EAB2655369.1 hypothetical protein [Salmonella enterica]ECU1104343.1 hypothetical protein [Salmonella enterica subsp. enterica]EEH1861320.1 hypothetical protein [Salmonella enterica subsp. houtenae serovar 50:g,z51:-]ESE88627.1 DNA primase traC [Salmonella enterica subsp. houtenae serovar 50:g,z51:- str. 01-0133]HAC6521029.1 hypothetical protein [Salmonella enterica subsp. houtenae serovar 45:g,z51:-]HAE7577904.1 hypothetical protein
MANYFTDLNNFIKQNPIGYMADFGIEVLEHQSQPCPICGGEDRFNWRSTGEHANTGHCRQGCGLNGSKVLQPLYIIAQKTGLWLRDIGARIGFNKSDKWSNPNHIYMRQAIKFKKEKLTLAELDKHKLELFTQNISIQTKNATWGESPYLLNKGISKMMWIGGHGQTLLDYYRADNTFCALQRLPVNAEKSFVKDSQFSGAFHCERNCGGNIKTIFIGEGFGTVTAFQCAMGDSYPASLFLTAGIAGNLLSVAIEARKYYPLADICILTDNDENKCNTGLRETLKVMEQVNKCWWAMPETTGEDWCDVFQRGKSALLNEFRRVLENSKPAI